MSVGKAAIVGLGLWLIGVALAFAGLEVAGKNVGIALLALDVLFVLASPILATYSPGGITGPPENDSREA